MAEEEKDESYYRRKEDREWRIKVDHEQVTLMTSVSNILDQLRELKARVRDDEITLHGDRKEPGLVADYERHDSLLIRLNSVVFQDSTGKHGLVQEVAELAKGEQRKERRWQSLTSIVIALISLIGSLILGWDKISTFLNKHSKMGPLEQRIERAKHRKGKTVVRYRFVAPTEDDENSAAEGVSE